MQVDLPSKLNTFVVFSCPVISGIFVLAGSSLPGSPLQPPGPTYVLITHFQLWKVWGCFVGKGRLVRSVGLHINHLKLEQVFLTLKKYQRWLCRTHVLV